MNSKPYFAQYIRSFFEDYLTCRRNLSANTIWSYRDAIKLFTQFVAERLKKPPTDLFTKELTESLVVEFLENIEHNRGNSVQTRNHRLMALRCLFKYISYREPLLLDHCRKILSIPLKRGAKLAQVRYLSKDEVLSIINAVDRSKPRGLRDHALILFTYNTGARVQEVSDMQISWLTLQSPYKVDILGKGKKWRTCPLWKTTVDTLSKYIEERKKITCQSDHLFLNRSNNPISRSGITYIIKKHTSKSALEIPSLQNFKITPHIFRHTMAMHLLQSGVELNVIKSWLGHVSITTTNRYIEIDLEMKKKALDICDLTPKQMQNKKWRINQSLLDWLESL